MNSPTTLFARARHPDPVDPDKRKALLENPGFGRVFTDHMVMIRYKEGIGWHDACVKAREPLLIDPAAAVLHYAQEIFEGLKAYRSADGGVTLFRPDANARRFQQSAERLAIAPLPEALFIDAVKEIVSVDREWVPDSPGGSLYLRPFTIATEVFLGVKSSADYLFMVIASPVGSYFKGNAETVSVWVSSELTRAAFGGTGAAKCGGNYAASLQAQQEAIRRGCDQVVFLDAAERRWVEELGGMNIFFVFADGSLQTPPLGGTILPGVTRDSVITLARAEGLTVREEPYAIEQWRADAASGKLREVFACGTAAVITPIGTVRSSAGDFTVNDAAAGPVAKRLLGQLTDIQRGRAPDPHNWVQRLF